MPGCGSIPAMIAASMRRNALRLLRPAVLQSWAEVQRHRLRVSAANPNIGIAAMVIVSSGRCCRPLGSAVLKPKLLPCGPTCYGSSTADAIKNTPVNSAIPMIAQNAAGSCARSIGFP